MILVAGAGAMADAARAMRRIQRDLNRRVDRTRQRARRRAVHYSDYGERTVVRTDFPCTYLCNACGYFVDDPGEEEAPEEACPACGETAWVDLAIEPLANRIREMEADERMVVPTWITVSVVVVTVVAVVALVSVLALAGAAEWAGLVAISSLGVIPLAYHVLPRPAAVWLLKGRERRPYRWHVPLPLPEPDVTPDETMGELDVHATDGAIEAPISGRECLAYQVCVLFDISGDARPPEWVLEEQRAVPVRLGETLQVGAAALFLESPVERVDAPGGGMEPLDEGAERDTRYDAIKKFLRKRGLFVTEGQYHFYEAVLEPGDVVKVEVFDDTYVLRDAAAAEDLPKLPEPG